jgi:hypothetical protein
MILHALKPPSITQLMLVMVTDTYKPSSPINFIHIEICDFLIFFLDTFGENSIH